MFSEESVIVEVWVKAIEKGEQQLEDVPDLSNLRDVVNSVVEGGGANV